MPATALPLCYPFSLLPTGNHSFVLCICESASYLFYAWFHLSLSDLISPSIMPSKFIPFQFSSVQSSRSVVSDYLRPHEPQHTRPPCPSPTPRVYPNPCPSSQWCHPAISSSVITFSSCLQSFPAPGSFQMSQLFSSDGQSTGVLASTSILPMNTQDCSPLGWTGWISQSKGLSRVFSTTTIQSINSLVLSFFYSSTLTSHTWPLEKP